MSINAIGNETAMDREDRNFEQYYGTLALAVSGGILFTLGTGWEEFHVTQKVLGALLAGGATVLGVKAFTQADRIGR